MNPRRSEALPGPADSTLAARALLSLASAALVLGVLGGLPGGGAAIAAEQQGNPRLALPPSSLTSGERAPILVLVQAGVGGDFEVANDQFGYGAGILFRPEAAGGFIEALASWNTSLLLRVDYQELFTHYRIRSGDFVLRKPLAGNRSRGLAPFLALGVGVSEISFAGDGERQTATDWSLLVELGWEVPLGGSWLLETEARYRRCRDRGLDYSGWAARAGLGFPLPW